MISGGRYEPVPGLRHAIQSVAISHAAWANSVSDPLTGHPTYEKVGSLGAEAAGHVHAAGQNRTTGELVNIKVRRRPLAATGSPLIILLLTYCCEEDGVQRRARIAYTPRSITWGGYAC
jgi:hypothetical protein